MNIYLESGYPNYDVIKEIGQKYIYILSGRGTGKSHFIVNMHDKNPNRPILYVRRTNVDLASCFGINSDFSKDDWFGSIIYKFDSKIGIGRAYLTKDDLNKNTPFIVGVSLSTFNNKTGINFTDFYDVIFDEFIPQKGAYTIKHEFQAYKNIMESVYRNRGDEDSEKITTWFFGNTNAIISNILIGYRLIPECYKMIKDHIEVMQVDRCETTLIMLFNSPISNVKNKNPFYRNLPDNKKRMEIRGEFIDMEDDHVLHQNVIEFTHEYKTPSFSVWKHKSEFRFYITKRMNNRADITLDNTTISLERWQTSCKSFLKPMLLSGNITFSDFEVQCDFLSSFDCTSWNDIT